MALTSDFDPALSNTLRLVYEGKWTWDEFHQAIAQLLEQSKAFHGQPWDMISIQYRFMLPVGDAIRHADQAFQSMFQHNLQSIVCVTDNRMFKMLGAVGISLHPRYREKFHVVYTLEDAYTLIRASREGEPARQ
jgi:hypothetical protein